MFLNYLKESRESVDISELHTIDSELEALATEIQEVEKSAEKLELYAKTNYQLLDADVAVKAEELTKEIRELERKRRDLELSYEHWNYEEDDMEVTDPELKAKLKPELDALWDQTQILVKALNEIQTEAAIKSKENAEKLRADADLKGKINLKSEKEVKRAEILNQLIAQNALEWVPDFFMDDIKQLYEGPATLNLTSGKIINIRKNPELSIDIEINGELDLSCDSYSVDDLINYMDFESNTFDFRLPDVIEKNIEDIFTDTYILEDTDSDIMFKLDWIDVTVRDNAWIKHSYYPATCDDPSESTLDINGNVSIKILATLTLKK